MGNLLKLAKNIGAKSVRLDKDKVKELFEKSTHQADVTIGLYRMVFPEWDFIEQMDGFPKVNHKTGLTLMQWFMEFDRKHHPNVMNGGCWLNHGFSSDEKSSNRIRDWRVERCDFTWKTDAILPMQKAA